MKDGRKMLQKTLIGFAGIVLAGVVFAVFFLLHDGPAPDTRLFVYSKTPENEAHAARMKALEERFPKKEYSSFWHKLPEEPNLYTPKSTVAWDHAAVAELLELAGRNGIWQALDDILRAPPPPQINKDSFEVVVQIKLARLLEIKARDDILRGHPDEALRTTIKMFDFSRKMSAGGGVFISWLGSMAIRDIALRTMAATIIAGTLPDESLREALAHVSASRTDARETADFLRGETAWVLDMWSIAEADPQFDSLFYKPNLTKRRYLERMARMISLAGCDEAALDASGIDRRIKGGKYNPYNKVGRSFLDMMWIDAAPSFRHDMELRSGASAVEALIAIRLYGSAHGRALPPSLEALVPDFLPAVPRDYFDGSAIRYSAKERVVWFPGRLKAAPPFVRGGEEKEPDDPGARAASFVFGGGEKNWKEYTNVFFLDPPPGA